MTRHIFRSLALVAIGVALLTTSPQGQTTQASGKLILFADTARFVPPPDPENCIVKNRFKRGENAGFRLYAVDGGTGKPETSAEIVVHLQQGGKTYDLPAIYRGVPQKNSDDGQMMPVRGDQWTAKWKVPMDAPTGAAKYTATAKDKYGRTAEWIPAGGGPSLVTVVQ